VVELGLVVVLPFHIQLKILQVPLGGVFVARLTNEMVRNSHHNQCAVASQKSAGYFHSDVIVQKALLVVLLVVTVT